MQFSPRRRAFTLIELLVVVAIIALLIAILLPSLGRARELSRKTVCGTQLKGQGTSFAIYANQWDDNLPSGPDYDCDSITATWLHDTTAKLSDTLIGAQTALNSPQASSARKWFYCPSNQVYNSDHNWSGLNSATLPNGQVVQKRVLGYEYFNARKMPANMLTTALSPSPRTNPPLAWRTKWTGNASEEVVEDIIVNVAKPNTNPSWGQTVAPTGTITTSVNHYNGNQPAGSNVLCLDGHVEFRNWNPNNIHWATNGGGPSGTVYFVIIDP